MPHREMRAGARVMLLAGTALAGVFAAGGAAAQAADESDATLTEIVVTAQKRAQNLQDVPISITAITADVLESARVTNVGDLNALAPNLSIRASAGGIGLPSFTVRGLVSYGVVPGSDKSVSMYVDGVYLGSTRGAMFDFAEIQRIEVLRGPQGTLFGRNATAGAVSIITRDPSGEFGLRQELTYGNYNQFRSKTRVDLPQWGPLSASITYVHDQRDGDIKNLGAGARWDRTGMGSDRSPIGVSPKHLGSKNLESVFAAVKFEPTDDFSIVYKFDYAANDFTPEGVAAVAINPAGLGPSGALLSAILANQASPVRLYPDARRPKSVNNSWAVPGYSKNYGHSVTAQLRINDNLSIKNILAYRYGYIYTMYQYDGVGGLVNTVAALGPVGAPFVLRALNNEAESRQWSNETQINYDSKLVTLTAGALYFQIKDFSGPPPGLVANRLLGVYPGGRVAPAFPAVQQSYNFSESKALYLQAEVHVMPQLDLVGGYRITQDDKSGTLYNPAALPFEYNKTKPSYMAGVNYKPTSDILVYGKYSTGFVSGGSVSNIAFPPERARSWEGGVKADLFDRRLRANLAVFSVKYYDIQSAQGGPQVGRPELSTLIVSQGDGKAKGFEFETSAAVASGLTVGGGLGYTDFKFTRLTPLALQLLGTLATYQPTLRPKWTGQLWGQYETDPLFGDATLRLRVDANWRSKQRLDQDPTRKIALPSFAPLEFGPSAWTVNARAALDHVKVAGADAEVAVWVKNLNNDRSPAFANVLATILASTSFVPARTFGIDVTFEY